MSTATFKHSGPLGDIIYSLPAVKALGGGVLYLDVEGGKDDEFVTRQSVNRNTGFGPAGYQTIRPLLMEQPFIEDVRIWQNEKVDYNLDSFRTLLVNSGNTNLTTLYLRRFGLDESHADTPWLS